MAILHVGKNEFEEEVLKAQVPVLVDFWAGWCGPCKMLAPVLEEAEAELDGKAKVCKVDVDAEGELAMQYGVMSIPTLIVFENGQIKNQLVGFVSKEEILALL